MVVTAHPLASGAALAALNDGGSAIDALVSAQAVLAVVEPQSSGLAGGGFLLHWNAQERRLAVLDGREVAPEGSRPDDLLNASSDPLPWRQATAQANAIGIPGTVALLWEAHQSHGHLPWARTLEPAIRLASSGFLPSPRLLRSIRLAQRFGVGHSPAFQELYLPGGQPPAANQPFRNPNLAKTLKLLARKGAGLLSRTSGAADSGGCQRPAGRRSQLPRLEPRRSQQLCRDPARPLCSHQLRHQICTIPAPVAVDWRCCKPWRC